MPLNSKAETGAGKSFAEALDKHLNALQVTRRDFLKTLNIAESQFYRWQKNTSSPTRVTVNRIAAALAEQGNKTGDLESLLSDLLQAAGYLAFPGYSEITNRAWHAIKFSEPRTLVLGWIPCPPWAEESPTGHTGISITVAEHVSQLLGIEALHWKRLEWDTFTHSLARGEVHAVCPILINHPSRRWDLAFAGRLPIKITLGVVAKRDAISGGLPKVSEELRRLQLFYVKGEIGEAARYILFGGAGSVQDFPTLEDAAAALDSASGTKTPIIVSELATCKALATEYKYLEVHEDWELLRYLDLGVSFGISPYEPMLRKLLDDAVEFLKESPVLTDLYRIHGLEVHTESQREAILRKLDDIMKSIRGNQKKSS